MDEQQEIGRLRDHFHELNNTVGALAGAVGVVQAHQTTQGKQLDRIETAVVKMADKRDEDSGRLKVLETRADDAKIAGAKWGAGLGALLSALITGIAQAFGGSR